MPNEPGSTNLVEPTRNTLSTTAEKVANVARTRRFVRIKNLSSTIEVYYGGPAVASTTGSPIPPLESEDVPTSDEVWMVAASGTPAVSLTEFTD